jgi:phage terminase large subunit
MLAEAGETGLIVGARELMNSLDESSMAEVKAAIAAEPWLQERYDVGEKYIRTADKRISFEFIGLRHNLDSVKSKSKIHIFWVDEAEPVTETAWQKAVPSVREENSEIWVTWNPERKQSATHKRFRETPPASCKIVALNYRDNPKFPGVLEMERADDLLKRPDQYEHIWEGAFRTIIEGAYFAKHLAEARRDNRIGRVAKDPLMTMRAVWDIGGTGMKSDATAIWIVQFIGREIRILDYYEAVGQDLATHVAWLRSKGYEKALCVLPHDGAAHEKVYATTYEGSLRQAGFDVKVIKNQGNGAAMIRVEAARRLFPMMWFNEETTKGGLEAIGWYHEKRNEDRTIGLGPEHDWSSHGADAFGLIAVSYEQPTDKKNDDWSKFRHGAYV